MKCCERRSTLHRMPQRIGAHLAEGANKTKSARDRNHPSRGTAFTTTGHYGSGVIDSCEGRTLEINICDGCLNWAVEIGSVIDEHYSELPERQMPVPVMLCGLCKRAMHNDEQSLDLDAMNCAGDCLGCIREIEEHLDASNSIMEKREGKARGNS